ncbi:MAG: hypothetical protein H6977_07430 [Gammaproteobacteria bacterium]|nr:hypothetical protein [Gammaproteobacteria bacterium]MCP5199827.1 hypothetical protein [Gammaproteobacteria bacterium]
MAVIAHPGAAPLARRELVEVYRGKRRVDDAGERIVPLNLPGDDDVRRAFSLALLGQLPEDLEAYWNERYFHGISPPYVVSSVEAMLRFVAVTPGAIGYVPRCAADDRVAVVALIEVATPLPACAPAR